jgi:single-strand DNA-binding protein
MINNVVLVGRITKDADLRYISNGDAVATFTLAVNRQYTNQAGEREADFINCVLWKKAAENFANFTRKGSLIGIQGRIQTRNYENQQGQRVYVTEVVTDNFTLLEKKGDARDHSNNPSGQSNNRAKQQGFDEFNQSADPFSSAGESIDIGDDDLPF